jgi:hypothetical protein
MATPNMTQAHFMHDWTAPPRVQAAPRNTAYRHGYLDGYAAAIDAFTAMGSDPDTGIGEAVRRADHHHLYQLYDWRYSAAEPGPPPAFEGNAVARSAVQEAYARVPEYRHGYMDGWEAAVDAFTLLLAGCHSTFAEAATRSRNHLVERLGSWCTACPTAGPDRPPALVAPGVM